MKLFVKIGALKMVIPATLASQVMEIIEHGIIVEQKDYWDPNKGLIPAEGKEKSFQFVDDAILSEAPEAIQKLTDDLKSTTSRWLEATQERDKYKKELTDLKARMKSIQEASDGVSQ